MFVFRALQHIVKIFTVYLLSYGFAGEYHGDFNGFYKIVWFQIISVIQFKINS